VLAHYHAPHSVLLMLFYLNSYARGMFRLALFHRLNNHKVCFIIHSTSCRGHLGGLLGGAAVSALLGPNYVRSESTSGTFIKDQPPVKLLASPERQISVAATRHAKERGGKKSSKKSEGSRDRRDLEERGWRGKDDAAP